MCRANDVSLIWIRIIYTCFFSNGLVLPNITVVNQEYLCFVSFQFYDGLLIIYLNFLNKKIKIKIRFRRGEIVETAARVHH